ncbi:MAG: zinc ribbon domain-containing protein [Lachnospiraceae bacterium]|nr:zinc ribbon domain-containing protein [Lachnospiraceae bacterium]
MAKKYKCEYCGRKITEEVCPYCGAINSFFSDSNDTTSSESDTGEVQSSNSSLSESASHSASDPSLQSKPGQNKNSSGIFTKIIVSVASLILIFIFISIARPGETLTPPSLEAKEVPTKDPTPTPIFDVFSIDDISASVPVEEVEEPYFIATPDKNGFMVAKDGYFRSSHVVEVNTEEVFSAKVANTEYEFTLPCSYPELKTKVKIVPPRDYISVPDDPLSPPEIETIESFKDLYAHDTYDILDFAIFNNSFETKKIDECICDTIRVANTTKLSSLKFQGKELMAEAADIINSFGEPSEQQTYLDIYSITYQTTCGSIYFLYAINEDKTLSLKPTFIKLSHCAEERTN